MEPIVERLRAEFLEMPGLRLTAQQVHRLCGVDQDACRAVLDVLVSEKFLCAKPDGTYARLTDGVMWRPRPAKVELVRKQDPLRQAS
jgi:hypothetical protein